MRCTPLVPSRVAMGRISTTKGRVPSYLENCRQVHLTVDGDFAILTGYHRGSLPYRILVYTFALE